jgi:hypothetical protein
MRAIPPIPLLIALLVSGCQTEDVQTFSNALVAAQGSYPGEYYYPSSYNSTYAQPNYNYYSNNSYSNSSYSNNAYSGAVQAQPVQAAGIQRSSCYAIQSMHPGSIQPPAAVAGGC